MLSQALPPSLLQLKIENYDFIHSFIRQMDIDILYLGRQLIWSEVSSVSK